MGEVERDSSQLRPATETKPRQRSSVIALTLVTPTTMALLVGSWNPWNLVVFQDNSMWLFSGFLVSTILAAFLLARAFRRGRIRSFLRAVEWIGVAVTAVTIGVSLSAHALTPFVSKRSEIDYVVSPGVAVRRSEWDYRPFHACAEFRVQSGSGWSTRFGPTTRCVDLDGSSDWVPTGLGGVLVITRTNGATCSYNVDIAKRQLRSIDATGCKALGVA